jgi:hypothetical protein
LGWLARTTLPHTPNVAAKFRFQWITVATNTNMMAALSEPMTARGTTSLWYFIGPTCFFDYVRYKTLVIYFGSAELGQKIFSEERNDIAAGRATVGKTVKGPARPFLPGSLFVGITG